MRWALSLNGNDGDIIWHSAALGRRRFGSKFVAQKSGRREAMRKWVRSGLAFGLSMMVSLSVCDLGRADDTKAGNDSKPSAPKAVTANKAETGLTDRERWLLERVEQLEKRVADLESKDAKPAAESAVVGEKGTEPGTSVSGGMTAAAKPAASAPSAMLTSPPAGAVPSSMSTSIAAAIGPNKESSTSAGLPQAPEKKKIEPFSDADWTWLNGNPRTKEIYWDSKFFTPEIRADINYVSDFNHPTDHSIGGSSELFRSSEVQLEQLGVGGDFHYDNVRGRLMTQFGMYSVTTPRNDPSPGHGQWDLANAYRYVSEAYGGYHFNVLHGINVDAGIFMSYVGLFSYYQFDNWTYQPSYVSSNTPWFFNGVRVQIFPTEHLKIEPWFVNGWQSYGRFNNRPGFGMQILWRPSGWLSILGNQYALGEDAAGVPGRVRYHTDDSIEVKYYDKPENFISKAAFSLTGDMGCEHGGGVSCWGNSAKGPKQSFLGYMLYNRLWFHKDEYGLTIGGGKINNPGRYLVLLPPINGATASSGTPYFTENPGDPFKAWDISGTFDYMPSQYITFRWEFDHRAANVPYFSGPSGVTPTSCPMAPLVENVCGTPGAFVPGFTPDLKKIENRIGLSILVKF